MADNSNATGSPAPADATGTADAAAAVGAADVAVDIGAATPTDANTGLTTNPTAAASPPAVGGEAGGDDASAPAPAADASSPAPAPSSGAGGDAPANGAETAGTAGTTPAPVTQAAAPAPATDNGATKEASGSETKAEPAHAGGHGGDALRASHGVSEDIASRRRAASEQAKMMMSHRKRPSNGRYSLSYGFTQYSKVPAVVLAVGIATFLFVGLSIIGITSWAHSYPGAISEAVPGALLELLMAGGFCLVAVAAIGAYGALDRSRMKLRWFVYVGLVVMALEIAAGVTTMTWLGDNDKAYLDKIAAGTNPSTFNDFEERVDNALEKLYTACCDDTVTPWVNTTDCEFLAAFDVPKSVCASRQLFKPEVVHVLIEDMVRPLAIVALALLAPQILSLIVVAWLLCKLDPVDHHVPDDIDHEFAPIPCDADGIPIPPETDEFPYVFALVFPPPDENPARKDMEHRGHNSMEGIIARLRRAGLRVRAEWDTTQEHVIVRVAANRTRLEVEADRINYKLRLDSRSLRIADKARNLAVRGKADELTDSVGSNRWGPYDYIYCKYDAGHELGDEAGELKRDPNETPGAQKRVLYRRDRATLSKFREIDVVKLVFSIIQGDPTLNPPGAGLACNELMHKGYLTKYFPLHNRHCIDVLHDEWLQWLNGVWDQPLVRIRNYFGEKVALYVAFSAHYTKWLLAPALMGAACFAHQRGARDHSVNTITIFAFFIALWATLMLEYWKRERHHHVKEWGMSDFEALEVKRPQFINNPLVTKVPSPVTGLNMEYFDPKIKRRRVVVSWISIGTLIAIVLTAVFSIFVLRLWFVSLENDGTIPVGAAGNLAAAVNAVQIQLLNLIYGRVARYLNKMENHATQTEFEDNLIAKTFCFQFINSYFSLFYIAFIKNYLELFGEKQECALNSAGEADCIDELSSQLMIIFLTRLVVGNTTEALVPWAKFWWKRRQEAKLAAQEHRDNLKKSPAELQNDLMDYDTFDDYAEHVIQFGYVTLFVVAFPLAPMLAFVNNYVELRVDAFKLVHNCVRPDPMGAQDIGTWFKWLQLMANVGVISNLALVSFVTTGDSFVINWMNEHPVWAFVMLEHALFLTKFLFDALIPDIPPSVIVQQQRQDYLVDKLIFGIDDDLLDEALYFNATGASSDAAAQHKKTDGDAPASAGAGAGAGSAASAPAAHATAASSPPHSAGVEFATVDPVEYDANAGVGWAGTRRRYNASS